MLSLCLLLLIMLLLAAALSCWLAETAIAGTTLIPVFSLVVSTTLVSVLYFISLPLAIPFWAFLFSSLLAGSGLIYYCLRKRHSSLADILSNVVSFRASIYTVAALALICYLSSMFIPHSGRWGRWDARAIWTLHALFLTDAGHWRNMFSPAIAWTHADYPLLLSSLVAMFWRTMGNTNALVPCLAAYLIFVAALLIVYSGLSGRGRPFLGILGLMVFASTPAYAKVAAFQGADSLLSLFILMPFVITGQNEKGDDMKLALLTGLVTGFAGWVKNEGLAFILIFTIGFIWKYRKKTQLIKYYIGGLLMPLILIFFFKIYYAPSNDIVSGQGHNTLSRLLDMSRYRLTAKIFLNNLVQIYPMVLGIIVLVIIRGYRRLLDTWFGVLVAMFVGYYFIFIITPRDLQWHLETASERLFLQLFPAFVFVLLFLLGRSPDKIAATN